MIGKVIHQTDLADMHWSLRPELIPSEPNQRSNPWHRAAAIIATGKDERPFIGFHDLRIQTPHAHAGQRPHGIVDEKSLHLRMPDRGVTKMTVANFAPSEGARFSTNS
jgi:hypothetical protein